MSKSLHSNRTKAEILLDLDEAHKDNARLIRFANERDEELIREKTALNEERKKVDTLKALVAALREDLARAQGYIDRIRELEEKPVERVVSDPLPPRGPILSHDAERLERRETYATRPTPWHSL